MSAGSVMKCYGFRLLSFSSFWSLF